MRITMRRFVAMATGLMLVAGSAWAAAQQEPGAAERAGEKLDEAGREAGRKLDEAGRKIRRGLERGFDSARDAVRETFDQTRDRVNEMSVQSRVYGRLHWDKMLVNSNLELTAEGGGVVTLRGTVPSKEARQRAVELATDTVGVERVIDRLTVGAEPPAEAVRPKVRARTPAPVDR